MTFGNRSALTWLTVAAVLLPVAFARPGTATVPEPSGAALGETPVAVPNGLDGRRPPPLSGLRALADTSPDTKTESDPLAELCVPPIRGCGVPPPSDSETWLRRPYSIGWLFGLAQGGPLIDDWVGLGQGLQGGLRFGWDFDDCWGVESRFAYASLRLDDSERARQTLWDADTADGYADDSLFRRRFDHRDADLFQWDVDLLYYPCGDTWWRPYVLLGVGLSDIRFTDRVGQRYHRTPFSLPIGLGMKYRWSQSLAVRLDFTDDIAFLGDGFETVNNLSLTLAMEIRFGGPRRTYWPWNPQSHGW